MRCGQVKDLLSAYLDHMLAADECQQVAHHLQHCQACTEILADFRRYNALLSQLPRITPDLAVRQNIFLHANFSSYTGNAQSGDQDLTYLRLPSERSGGLQVASPHPKLLLFPLQAPVNPTYQTPTAPFFYLPTYGQKTVKLPLWLALFLFLTVLLASFLSLRQLQHRKSYPHNPKS
ncbi:anti-sigma factor family protein [Tengunoibacter tsumagoiensis]|uniref:Putative zinc-finger domain-containing protein n=1 Tax=Tengunoibacter tsumagoiensis TaxID=2014871 RepID=A0A402A2J3_9CHLR|nr:zf-HC2 domain-containing protein [Tengunoibacter tsumagoiensis]GCE13275.1 hypothetical protein KTT_31340 [Tengunoibacter tsumagoiensis]